MESKKYFIYQDQVEIPYPVTRFKRNWSAEEIIKAYDEKSYKEPQLFGEYNNADEAIKAFSNVRVYTGMHSGNVYNYLLCDVAYIAEITFDVPEGFNSETDDIWDYFDHEDWIDDKADPYDDPYYKESEDDDDL